MDVGDSWDMVVCLRKEPQNPSHRKPGVPKRLPRRSAETRDLPHKSVASGNTTATVGATVKVFAATSRTVDGSSARMMSGKAR